MKKIKLTIELLSDTCLGSGGGLAGLVDQELLYDSLGFPMANGKTVKGWLVEACADILAGLDKQSTEVLKESADRLFGKPGDGLDETLLFIGDAHFPDEIRVQETHDFETKKTELLVGLNERDTRTLQIIHGSILSEYHHRVNANKDSYSRIRHQTAIESSGEKKGVAKDGSLRTIRVINRGNTLVSELQYFGSEENEKNDFALLCAVVSCVRRIGLNRTRGLGKVKCSLLMNGDDVFFERHIKSFVENIVKEDK